MKYRAVTRAHPSAVKATHIFLQDSQLFTVVGIGEAEMSWNGLFLEGLPCEQASIVVGGDLGRTSDPTQNPL